MARKQLLTALIGLAALAAGRAAAQTAPPLMPAPVSVSVQPGRLVLAGPLEASPGGCGPAVADALLRFRQDMAKLSGFAETDPRGPALRLSCRTASATIAADRGEAYRLRVETDGVALDADGPAGVLRGLATLRQLVETDGGEPALPLVRVEDRPRFAWRGVMIDTARHFVTVPTLKRQIDAMERVKLNVLHLHLSDTEAFRVESRRFPKLQAQAGPGAYYTQAEIRDLVAYAAARGVRVVPEFDLPAHAGAILRAYPELAAQLDPKQPLAGVNPAIDPTSEKTYRFVAALYREMAGLFPDPDFHVGGDEVSDGAWSHDPRIVAFMAAHGLKSRQEMEAYFHTRVRAVLQGLNKTPVGWEEIAATPIPAEVVVQAWRTSNATASATAAGHPTIVSAGYYLDLLMPAARSYAIDPFDVAADGFTPEEVARATRASPLAGGIVKDLELKPLPPLTDGQKAKVLGGEMALWSELVSDEMVDHRLWPRAAALAERFWSPAEVRDIADMERRLPAVETRLELLGLDADANRQRIASRLAPQNPEVVLTFLAGVAPAPNMAHNHTIRGYLRGQLHPPAQRLTALADAAAVDDLAVLRLDADAAAFAKGDASATARLRAQLARWRDNHPAFAQLAASRPELAPATDVSARLADLASAGLELLDAAQSGVPLAAAERSRITVLIDAEEARNRAYARPIFALMAAPPPADVVITIAPAIRRLLEATPQAR